MEPYQQLENNWALFNQLDPAGMVACSSGTAALHLALEALQLPQGSKVIVPDFTMIACPRAVTLAGLEPVFVDCDERLLMDGELVNQFLQGDQGEAEAESWGSRLGAIMAVHVYGRQADMGKINDVADLFGLKHTGVGNRTLYVVEDLAEAHGVKPHPRTDAACWSFYASKHVHGEEGGAVWFRDPEHARLARSLRCLGFNERHDYVHVPRGWNHRLANSLAKLILKSLGEFDSEMVRRREAEGLLEEACQREWLIGRREAPWVFDFRVPGLTAMRQEEIVIALRNLEMGARYGFKPMHVQPEYRGHQTVGGLQAERASREVIYLPMNVNSVKGFDVVRRFAQD